MQKLHRTVGDISGHKRQKVEARHKRQKVEAIHVVGRFLCPATLEGKKNSF
jgi:hypothetical protein